MQHLRRAFDRDLRPLHQGRLPQSLLREMRAMQRLLPVRIPAAAGLTIDPGSWSSRRAGRCASPENTIAAFEYAIGVGVDAIEMDVVVSRDDVVVVSHDPYLKSGTFIRELTAAESGLPTLDEVFALAAAGIFFLISKPKFRSTRRRTSRNWCSTGLASME